MILRTAAQIWSTKSEHGFSATWEDLIFRRKAVSWVIAANSATFVLFKRLVGILHSVQAFYCGLDSKRSKMMLENPPHSAVACLRGEGRASSCQIWASPQSPARSKGSEAAETARKQRLWVVEFGFARLSNSLVLRRLEDTPSCVRRCMVKCIAGNSTWMAIGYWY